MLIERQRNVAIVLNPKVASTFFRAFVVDGYREQWNRTDPSEGRYGLFRFARRFPFAPIVDYANALAKPGEYEAFTFVRNPYSRLRSAWVDKFLHGHQRGYARSVRQKHLAVLRRFARKNGLEGAEDGSLVPFETLLAVVEAYPPGAIDHHWDRQTSVTLSGHFPKMTAFRIEDQMEDGFTAIFYKRFNWDPAWVAARFQLNTISRRNSGSADVAVYNEALAERVYRAFFTDFEKFGYSPDSWRE